MDLGALPFLLLILACPLMMVWMMRGHGGHGGSHGSGHNHMHGSGAGETGGSRSLDELRRRRAELEAEIATLEEAETEPKTPAAV